MSGVSQTSVVALDKDKEGSTSGYLGPSEEDYSLMLIQLPRCPDGQVFCGDSPDWGLVNCKQPEECGC